MREPSQVKMRAFFLFLACSFFVMAPDKANAGTCSNEILNANPQDGDIFVSSPNNPLKRASHDSRLLLQRDARININFIVKSDDLHTYRAVAFLRKTNSTGEGFSDRNLTISNNLRNRGEATTDRSTYHEYHRREISSRLITTRFHVLYDYFKGNSFNNIQDTRSFLNFFDDNAANYWGRMQRYRGMRTNIMCATITIFTSSQVPRHVTDVDFRVISLSETETIPSWHDFQLNFGEFDDN